MKTKIIGFLLLGLASAAFAIEPAELDNRIRALTDKFDALQHQPDKCIPPETLRKAQGIVLLDCTKAGFLFAYKGGSGVAMVKDLKLGKWSPVAFLGVTEASLGFQIGGEQHFYVMLLMTTNATRRLLDQKIDFSGEARGTAGDKSSGTEAAPPPESSVLVYVDRVGLYAGAAVKGGAIWPDDEADRVYYGTYSSMGDILFDHKVQPGEAASILANKIQGYSQIKDVSKTAAR